MGLFRDAYTKFSAALTAGWTLLDPQVRWIFNIQPSTSGVIVNRFSALGLPPYYRAVNLLSDYVGRLPLDIYQCQPNGGQEIDDDHVSYDVIRRPHQLYNRMHWLKTTTAHALMYGNGYTFIDRDEYARPTELLILDPEYTYIEVIGNDLFYKTQINNTEYTIAHSDVIHIRGLTHTGLVGYPLLELVKEALGLSLAAQKYGAAFFRNNAQPKMVITLPGKLKDKEAIEHFRLAWGAMHEGANNAAKTHVLEEGASVTTIPINNDEAQFLQTREFEVATCISSITGVPPHKLGIKINSGYNSLESENKAFLNDTLDMWLVQWEQELNYKLLTEYQKKVDKHYFQFDRTELQRADAKTENEILISKLNNGAITQEQYNALTNQPNTGEPWEKWHRMPSNTVFIEKPPEPPPAPASPPGDDAEADDQDKPAKEGKDVEATSTPKTPTKGEDGTIKLSKLVTNELMRFNKRIHKAAERAHAKGALADWIATDLDTHRAVFAEALSPAFDDIGDVANTYFHRVGESLKTVNGTFPDSINVETADLIGRLDG